MLDANELQERLTKLQGLVNRKKASERELKEIEEEINTVLSEMRVTRIKHTNHRSNGKSPINNYILRIMAPGAHMALKTIAEKILEAGYETTNARFGSYLHSVLSNRKDIRKIRRGVYTRVASLIQKGRDENHNESEQN